MPKRNRDFFKLQDPYVKLCEPEKFFMLVKKPGMTVENILYYPDELSGSQSKFRLDNTKVIGITFKNVSFTRTYIHSIIFRDCKFKECLFINSWFERCEFHNCEFIDTNPHKIDFKGVYIDPNSFTNCLNATTDQNIGTHLYQRLMRNADLENQRDFARQASFSFNIWKRRQSFYEFRENWRSNPTRSFSEFGAVIFRFIWGLYGAGVNLRRFLILSFVTLFILSTLNFYMREVFGLPDVADFYDSLYFTVITMTTIGYGDITPASTTGKIVIAVEGLFGFFLFALAASIIVRRIWP